MSFHDHLMPCSEMEDEESRHYRARLNHTFVLFAMAGLACFLLFDYFQVPDAWPTLWLGRFLLLGVCVLCVTLLRRQPRRPDDIALLGAVCANLYFCFGATMIQDAITLSLWNLSFSTSMLIAMPAWLVWGWRYQLVSSLPLILGYLPLFLWLSPLSLKDLAGAGGAYMIATMIMAPALAHARSSTFLRTVKLRRALEVRNAELSHMNQQLLTQQHELEYRANHDLLTSLPNRRCGLEFLDRMLAASLRERRCLSILFVDVDRLKYVNDTFGHPQGDRLIQLVAAGAAQAAGEEGMACRLGGDEFLVVLPGACDMASQQAANQLMHHLEAQRLEEQIAFPVEVSIGRVTHDSVLQGEISVQDLIHIADDRMYRQKRAGRHAVVKGSNQQA